MPKYTITVAFDHETFVFDTDDFEDDFAKTKDDLADKLDPTDVDAVRDWAEEHWSEYELIDTYDLTVNKVGVQPAK